MARDAKDFIISELELLLKSAIDRYAQAQLLNCVLEKHSHVLETKLNSAMTTIKLLQNHHLHCGNLPGDGDVATMASTVGQPKNSPKAANLPEELLADSTRQNCVQQVGYSVRSVPSEMSTLTSGETMVTEEAIVEGDRTEETLEGVLKTEFDETSTSSSQPTPSTSQPTIADSSPSNVTINHRQLLKCSSCRYSSTTKWKMVRHARVHTKEKLFKCVFGDCGSAYNQKDKLLEHGVRVHKGPGRFKCSNCPFQSHGKAIWSRHQSKCQVDGWQPDRNFQCNIDHCGKAFTRAQSLHKHHQRFHLEHLHFKCDHCAKRFLENKDLEGHVQRTHEKERHL